MERSVVVEVDDKEVSTATAAEYPTGYPETDLAAWLNSIAYSIQSLFSSY